MIAVGQGGAQQMHMILRIGSDELVNGLLLAASRRRLRIAVERRKDTLALRLVRGRWLSDDKSKVEIAFVLTNTAVRGVSSERVRVAGAAS